MIRKTLASTALLATTALAQNLGSAIVVNNCNYEVSMTNVPCSGGGQSQIGPQTLSQGDTYSQVYTPLNTGCGWSIKLAPSSNPGVVTQYEYTYQNDGTLWFDMSEVNGDPFGGDWAFSADNGCTTKDTAYQYPTDDAYGMQSCPASSSVTLTLCPGGGSSSSGGAPPVPSVPGVPSAPSVPIPSFGSPSAASPPPASTPDFSPPPVANENAVAPSPSTLATFKAANTVTNMHTVVVTEYITMSPSPVARASKREEHLHRHAHHHRL